MLYPIKMNIGWKCTQDIQDVDELLCNAQFLQICSDEQTNSSTFVWCKNE